MSKISNDWEMQVQQKYKQPQQASEQNEQNEHDTTNISETCRMERANHNSVKWSERILLRRFAQGLEALRMQDKIVFRQVRAPVG